MHQKSGGASQHGSMDGASSESPHPPRADSGQTLENGTASSASSTSHVAFRARQARNGVASQDSQPPRSQQQQLPQQQHRSDGSDMGSARGGAAGRGRGVAAVPPLSKDGSSAVAAATAAAAAALRPTPRSAGDLFSSVLSQKPTSSVDDVFISYHWQCEELRRHTRMIKLQVMLLVLRAMLCVQPQTLALPPVGLDAERGRLRQSNRAACSRHPAAKRRSNCLPRC